jgi:hypothetical protein
MMPAQLKLITAFTAAISWHAVTVYVGLWVAQGVAFVAGTPQQPRLLSFLLLDSHVPHACSP